MRKWTRWVHAVAATVYLGHFIAFCTLSGLGLFVLHQDVYLQNAHFVFRHIGHIQVEWVATTCTLLAALVEIHTFVRWNAFKEQRKAFRWAWSWLGFAAVFSTLFLAIGAALGLSLVTDYILIFGLVLTGMAFLLIGENWNAERFDPFLQKSNQSPLLLLDPRSRSILLPVLMSAVPWLVLWCWMLFVTFESTKASGPIRMTLALVSHLLILLWICKMYWTHDPCGDCFTWRGNQVNRAMRMFWANNLFTCGIHLVVVITSCWLLYFI